MAPWLLLLARLTASTRSTPLRDAWRRWPADRCPPTGGREQVAPPRTAMPAGALGRRCRTDCRPAGFPQLRSDPLRSATPSGHGGYQRGSSTPVSHAEEVGRGRRGARGGCRGRRGRRRPGGVGGPGTCGRPRRARRWRAADVPGGVRGGDASVAGGADPGGRCADPPSPCRCRGRPPRRSPSRGPGGRRRAPRDGRRPAGVPVAGQAAGGRRPAPGRPAGSARGLRGGRALTRPPADPGPDVGRADQRGACRARGPAGRRCPSAGPGGLRADVPGGAGRARPRAGAGRPRPPARPAVGAGQPSAPTG